MKEIEITLEAEDERKTVKRILSETLSLSRRQISLFKAKQHILVNDSSAFLTQECHAEDRITLLFDEEEYPLYIELTHDIEILYEDEDLLIVNKPAFLACHASKEHLHDNLGSYIEEKYEHAFPVHPVGRLDKDVSGIMLYAKNRTVTAMLSREKTDTLFHKKYLALVEGTIQPESDVLHYNIEQIHHRSAVTKDGKPCITHYHVLHQYAEIALLEVQIETGRKHQIRAGFAHFFAPLIGDTLYGSKRTELQRPALHCSDIEFIHPRTKQTISVHCPLPSDMKKLCD